MSELGTGGDVHERHGPHDRAIDIVDRAFDRLAALWPAFEPRSAQREMAARVYEAFRSGGRIAVEAPTGVGKSIAYLVPALLVAKDHRMRVVISTHTKNLQRQIIARDAPRVRDALAPELKLAVLKGRSSYLCMRAWSRRLQQELLPDARSGFMERVGEWIARTQTGDLEEIDTSGREEAEWLRALAAPEDLETGVLCNRHTPCFLRESRRIAAQSHVVIVNHALLLTHHFKGARVLPDYDVLIVDEAHTLGRVAQQTLERRASPARVRQAIARLTGGSDLSLLARARALLERRHPGEAGDMVAPILENLAAARRLGDVFFRELHGRLGTSERRYGRRDAESGLFEGALDPFLDALDVVVREGTRVCSSLMVSDLDGEEDEETVATFAGAVTQAAELLGTLRFNVEVPDGGFVHWYEPEPALCAVPLAPGRDLAERLHSATDRVLFTSATLASGADFGHFLDGVGLDRETCETLQTDTPFDLAAQVLALTTTMPLPTEPGFPAALAEALARLGREIHRKALVLLTSHRLLRDVHARLSVLLEGEPVQLLGQGIDGQREAVTDRFRGAHRAMLLGTSSFWEGVDFPGEELELLVVTRLPFPVPSHPVVAARCEAIEATGRSSFTRLMLPEAALRLKQGFGRLIRRGSDRGVFVILDHRIRTARYRDTFTATLPVPVRETETIDELVSAASRWLDGPAIPRDQ